MAYQYQTLTKDNPKISISLKADKRYFKLLGIFSESIEADKLSNLDFGLKLLSVNNSHSFEEPIRIGREVMSKGELDYLSVNYTPTSDLGSFVTILVEDLPEDVLELGLIYDIDNLSIPVTNPFKEFESHLKQPNNPRILFSAPFGHGKTTFLNLYFDEKEHDYEVFHIYPVNFSVSNNEDIFRYIKTELLFQLLGRDIEFENVDISRIKSVSSFIGKNIHNVFAPFIRLLPMVGRSLHDIYKDLYALIEKHNKEQLDNQLSEEELAKSFIKEVYEQEGSIFEDNFYTQLIRQLIEQLKEKGKQIVWVIDDLDRMDPDHIFRILNVLSAHVDDYNSEMLGFSNKFGFDKTILVADYNNLTSIFNHKYGVDTDSRGYFDKFFSKNIFYYNNVDAVQSMIDEYTLYNNDRYDIAAAKFLRLILRMLLKTNNLSLREIIQMTSIGNQALLKDYGENSIYVPFMVLFNCFSLYEIQKKLSAANLTYNEKPMHSIYYDYFIWMIFIQLANHKIEDGIDSKYIKFNDHVYSFKTTMQYMDRIVDHDSILKDGVKPSSRSSLFNGKDFADAVMMLFRSYKENQVAIENEFKRYF